MVVDRASYELEYVNVEAEAEGVKRLLEAPGASVKVVFESPTLLKDPLAIDRQRKKTFLLLPEAVLSTPIYMLLADTGRLRQSFFRKLMVCGAREGILSTQICGEGWARRL